MSMSMDDNGAYHSGKTEREPSWDAEIKWFSLPADGEVHSLRPVAGPYYYATHWTETKKKDGSAGKAFPTICKNYDPKTNQYAENGCEHCQFIDMVRKVVAENKLDWQKDLPARIQRMSRRKTMAQNVIVRELQEQGAPANNAKGWSFIQPIRFPQGVSTNLYTLMEKFNKKKGEVFALSHKTQGRDLMISYDPESKDPNTVYQIQLGDTTPLTEEELSHAPYLTDFASFMKYPKEGTITETLQRNGYYEWLEQFQANINMKTISKGSGAAQQQTAPPKAPPANQQQSSTAFDVAGDGGMGAAETSAKDEPEPAPAKPAVKAPAPKVEAKAEPEPEQAPPAKQETAPAPSPAPAAKPTGNGIEAKLAAFSQSTSIPLVESTKDFSENGVKLYKTGMNVPACFTQYNQTDKTICKQCPLRLDCMMVTE